MNRLRVPIARQANGEALGRIEHPDVAGFLRLDSGRRYSAPTAL